MVSFGKWVTLYPSQVMSSRFDVEIDQLPAPRPLAEVLVTHLASKSSPGLNTVASSYNLNGGPLLAKKPEGACDYSGVPTKTASEWMNAIDPPVEFLSLVLEVVKNYDVDGIRDDRMPALPLVVTIS